MVTRPGHGSAGMRYADQRLEQQPAHERDDCFLVSVSVSVFRRCNALIRTHYQHHHGQGSVLSLDLYHVHAASYVIERGWVDIDTWLNFVRLVLFRGNEILFLFIVHMCQ